MKTNPTRRFIVVSIFALGLVGYWFATIGQSSDFPTGEVQYSTIPSLLHPYQQAWQSPYSAAWYVINIAVMGTFYPIIRFFVSGCPNNCVALVNYVNGTQGKIPFESSQIWPLSISWFIGLVFFNIFFFYIFRKSELLLPYFATSLWFLFTTPVNLSILWIIVLAYVPFRYGGFNNSWLFLPAALLIKLPVGAPQGVWNYALHSASTIGHWFPYGLLGAWVLIMGLHHADMAFHNGNVHWFQWLSPTARTVSQYE